MVITRARQRTTLPSLAKASISVNHPEQRLLINMVTLCLLREIHSMVPRFAAPRQPSFDFKLEGQTEKCADEDNQAKYHHVLDGGRYDDGSDDVAGNQKFQ